MNCEANSLVEEMSDVVAHNGLLLGDLKKLHNYFVRVADKVVQRVCNPCRNREAWTFVGKLNKKVKRQVIEQIKTINLKRK